MIKRMHYKFRQGLNKLDSQKNRNIRVPEIDQKLRIAELNFIQERSIIGDSNTVGILESDNVIREELKNVITKSTITGSLSDNLYSFNLPNDYMFFVKCVVNVTKNTITKNIPCIINKSYGEKSPFKTSSFEWNEINGVMYDGQIHLSVDGFTINEVDLSYVKIPRMIHNAEDSGITVSVLGSNILSYYSTYNRTPKGLSIDIGSVDSGTSYSINGYKSLENELLFGYVDTELSSICEDKIVESAVLDTISDLTTDVNLKAQLNN